MVSKYYKPRILVICATFGELSSFFDSFKGQVIKLKRKRLISLETKGLQFIGATVGIGPDKASRNGGILLNTISPDLLIVSGICGAVGSFSFGQALFGQRVIRMAFDKNSSDFKAVGHTSFDGNTLLNQAVFNAIAPSVGPAWASFYTRSQPLFDDIGAKKHLGEYGNSAIDMESWHLAWLAESKEMPWLIARTVSDKAKTLDRLKIRLKCKRYNEELAKLGKNIVEKSPRWENEILIRK